MALRSRATLALTAGVVLGFSAALAGNVFADRRVQAPGEPAVASESVPWEDARLLAEVLERVKRDYVEAVDDHELMELAIRGMVSALDPHSAFLDDEEYDEMRVSTAGSYPGIGIEVASEAGAIRIVRPIEGSPAEAAGLRTGDAIVSIDDEPVGLDLDAAIQRMRGPSGSAIRLGIRRDGEESLLYFALHRAQVEVHSVAAVLLEPDYGYLRISNFSESTPQDVKRALGEITARGARDLRGLVIDLRNNPGGVLEAAVAVSDEFLDSGLIVSADGRTPDARFRMEATPGDAMHGAEIVVLINSGSASAAEILAGALQDHRRAVLVGRTTYGKGSVQTVMPLSRGRAIKLTTSRYFTPSGASIHDKGITPDVVFEGVEPPPATLAMIRGGGASLLAGDSDLGLALATLKSRSRLAQVDGADRRR